MSDNNDQTLPFEQPIPVGIEDEMKRSYLDYAMSVIIGRALPDVRKGLNPLHRRALYVMWESGNRSDRPYKKSARIVGDVMGKYHPHGDSAIYDTVVRMAQDFAMRYPLVDGQGNFGSLDGDNPAAMRYTEVRLMKLAEEMLRDDIDKETVDWGPNYDGSETEPLVLPARVPNLLVNGAAGIAVGMATNIPPHNLREVVDALLMLIENPDVLIKDLMTVIPGPDFPTAGFIHGLEGIRSAYTTGRGIIQLRARVEIETNARTERQAIVVSEIPYQVNKKRLIEHIAELIRDKKLEGVSDLRDESDRDGIRIVIEVKRDAIAEILLNSLYKMTQLQTTFGIILLAIVDNQPRVMTLKELLYHFLNHRKTVVITVSQSGYVKRSPLSLYRAQARGGKGRTGMVTKEDDFVEHLYVATAHSYILVFTESGRVHWLKVHEIPEAGPAARGKAIVNLLNLEPSERLATTVAVREFRDDRYLVFATANGTVKKTELSAFSNPRVGGIIGINIDEGDCLLAVRETDGKKDILLATAKGKSIRFPESDVRSMGRATYGVKGLELRAGDRLVAMEELDPHGQVLTV